MNRILERLARSAVDHPWRALARWAAAVAVVAGLAVAFGGPAQENWDNDLAPAQRGVDLLREHLPGYGNTSAQVVVHSRDDRPVAAADLADLASRLDGLDHVSGVLPPRVSADSTTAMLTVQYDAPVTDQELMGDVEPLERAVHATRTAGYQVELGGELPGTAEGEMSGTGELIGVVGALVILLWVFRAVVAAKLPVLVAVGGLVVGGAGITVLCGLMDVSPTAPTVATMVGLGVGIDYALLLLVRILDELAEGAPLPDAVVHAGVVAGRSVVMAGSTVLTALLGLGLSGLHTFEAFGYATAISVLAVMTTSLVLVPALCSLLRRWLEPRAVRRARRDGEPVVTTVHTSARARRWAERVAGRPLPWLLATAAVMLALAAPALDMRTWPGSGADNDPASMSRRAHDLATAAFGPGAPAPHLLVVDREQVSDPETSVLVERLRQRDDLATVSDPVVSPDGAIALVTAEAAWLDNDSRTPGLVADLRAEVPDGVEVTGTPAMFSDISDVLAQRMPLVLAFVVGTSVLLLMMMFRSVLIPIKAAVMNLLSVGAAYGVMTAVFQWGWGVELLGVDHAMPVSTWLPMLMFTILFGLSMDYEVFLLSRIREDWLHTGDAHRSVSRGLAATSKIITVAASIMVLVFLGFTTEQFVVVKQLGFGMAVAILLDATLVRMVLVPATMSLLGERNWWLPAWLDRLLPEVDAEARDAVPAPPEVVAAPMPSRADQTPERVPVTLP